MNLVIGILMFGLGLIACIAWFAELVLFFKGVLVCSLLFWGIVGIVIGLARQKSRGQLVKAKADAPSVAETKADERVEA